MGESCPSRKPCAYDSFCTPHNTKNIIIIKAIIVIISTALNLREEVFVIKILPALPQRHTRRNRTLQNRRLGNLHLLRLLHLNLLGLFFRPLYYFRSCH
jgi:hypothetical protein